MMISVFKCRPNAKMPDRAHPSDAGMDVFYCPDIDQFSQQKGGNNFELLEDNSGVSIKPNGNFMFQTGLKMGIPHGYMIQVCNRGSMGAKKSLAVAAHIVDSGYSGEILIDLHNIGTEAQTIKPGDKIAQLVMIPVIHAIPMVVPNEEMLYGMTPITISDRGEGRLGSSNAKTA